MQASHPESGDWFCTVGLVWFCLEVGSFSWFCLEVGFVWLVLFGFVWGLVGLVGFVWRLVLSEGYGCVCLDVRQRLPFFQAPTGTAGQGPEAGILHPWTLILGIKD